MQRSVEEIREIERHKYFLSQKKGCDVGWEFAETDWDREHSAEWRRAHQAPATGCCSTAAPDPVAVRQESGHDTKPNGSSENILREDSSEPDDRRPLRWLFTRLFQQQKP